MKDELLVKARKVLDDIWKSIPVKGRTWGSRNNTTSMYGSHITLMDFHQCVTIWERDGRLRIKAYNKGELFTIVMTCIKKTELKNKITIVD